MTAGAGPGPGDGLVCLHDGRTVALRDAGPDDAAAIARLLTELSPAAFRHRFQCERAKPSLTMRLARPSPVPGSVCITAAAADPGRLVAEARYVPIGGGAAELAITVLDEYQGAGLGAALLAALTARAAAAGLQRLRAVINLDNAPMVGLFTQGPWILAEATDEYMLVSLEMSVAGGVPGWPPREPGRRILVERRGVLDDQRVAALRAAGHSVRQCTGPDRQAGRDCTLVSGGSCRLAAGADEIISLLTGAEGAAVAAAHRRCWPGKLAG